MLRSIVLLITLLAPASQAQEPLGGLGSTTPRNLPSDRLDTLLSEVTDSWLFDKARVGLQVVDIETGEEVFARGSDSLLNPASTMKVLTAATALKNLGPSYRFTTEAYVDEDVEVQPDGTLEGNLYIKGHGDPTFVVEDLWKMIRDLELTGVETITGNIIFDDSFHSGSVMLPGWDKKRDIERGPTYFSTLSALSLNMNTAVMVMGPGASVGAPGSIELETPTMGYVEVNNELETGRARSRRRITIERELEDNKTVFTVKGSFPIDRRRVPYRRTVGHPTKHFASAFQYMMRKSSIKVKGKYRMGVTPDTAELIVDIPSPPLVAVLMDMNKYSLNFKAEQVLRTVGQEVEGEGTTQAGLRVVRRYLQSIGVPEKQAVLVNGSGLSRDAFLSPTVLTAVLVDMARDPQVGSEFTASLSIGGIDGTLYRRLRDEPGRMRGKTGTLDGVHCLAGYLDADNGRRYAFAFLTNWKNRTRVSSVRSVHDEFARQVFKAGTEKTD
ncbi:MAG: D-alanyl-D-alanine carboxypeptidase/D-alanyl-D-alanine-endopeptidase [Myxococcota bacterium]